jgi:hypothetical protein
VRILPCASDCHRHHLPSRTRLPRVRGGTDELSNRALACVTCHGHKAAHVTGIDPDTSEETPLFDPRREVWSRHFRFSQPTLRIEGITAKGRATVARLHMNERKQIEARRLWLELGLYP